MKERGFTIIEVSLFLAISGVLILLTVGLWTMVARQRFQDTMVTLKSKIQSEYEEVRTNINERLGEAEVINCGDDGDFPPGNQDKTGNSTCLAIGKLIQFGIGNRQEIKISYVVATGDVGVEYSGKNDEDAIKSLSLRLIGSSSDYYVNSTDGAILPRTELIGWGGEFAGGWTITDSPQRTNAIAILHSPISSAVLVFTFKENPVNDHGVLTIDGNSSTGQAVAIMIQNQQVGFPGAAICIDPGPSSTAVRTAIPADAEFFSSAELILDITNKLRSLCGI
ncbi:hypothetical protein FWD20_03080 [Candidatus Saccharibacteria bacterium]|nr:hypothetical protein [Candidatus Saccharibacteria bacterium]